VEHRDEASRLVDKKWELQPGEEGEALTPEEKQFVKAYGNRMAEYMQHRYYNVVLLWVMWPATALMITSAMTAVLLKWRSIVASFHQLRGQSRQENREDVSLTTIVVGSLLLTIALAFVQYHNFGMSYVQTAVAVLCSLPLILVCTRVLGETN